MRHLGKMKRSKEVLKPSILLMPRRMPQMQRPFQLEAKPKKVDSLACNILSDPSDKFSKLPLTRTFPGNDHHSRHSRTLEHPAPHWASSSPRLHNISQGLVPNSSSPTTTTMSREDLVRLLLAQLAMTVNKHLPQKFLYSHQLVIQPWVYR